MESRAAPPAPAARPGVAPVYMTGAGSLALTGATVDGNQVRAGAGGAGGNGGAGGAGGNGGKGGGAGQNGANGGEGGYGGAAGAGGQAEGGAVYVASGPMTINVAAVDGNQVEAGAGGSGGAGGGARRRGGNGGGRRPAGPGRAAEDGYGGATGAPGPSGRRGPVLRWRRVDAHRLNGRRQPGQGR